MVWYDVLQGVTKLGLLQAQDAFVNLLVQNVSGVLVLHEFSHFWSHDPLVGVALFFEALHVHLGILFLLDFSLPHESDIMQSRVGCKLVFDVLHAQVERCGVTLA